MGAGNLAFGLMPLLLAFHRRRRRSDRRQATT
jgi:MYXO-CTERM domain-containing protein